MKTFSKEMLILEHYVKAAEEVMDGCTVRVWKPKTMGDLSAILHLRLADSPLLRGGP